MNDKETTNQEEALIILAEMIEKEEVKVEKTKAMQSLVDYYGLTNHQISLIYLVLRIEIITSQSNEQMINHLTNKIIYNQFTKQQITNLITDLQIMQSKNYESN